MTACLSHIEGEAAVLAGVADDGTPFVTTIPYRGVLALLRQVTAALMGIDRARQAASPTTDDPLPDMVGAEGE